MRFSTVLAAVTIVASGAGANAQAFPFDIKSVVGILCKILPYFPHAIQCPHKPPPPPKPTTTKTTATSTSSSTSSAPTPTASNGYIETFNNITAAVQADDFQTFGLVDTVDGILHDYVYSVAGCGFINSTFIQPLFPFTVTIGGSPLLTCSLFTQCHNATDADNFGGQSQPDGSIDFITTLKDGAKFLLK
ncbi:hypothetical protein BDZ97DRAFT_1806087 [Flammula alnicola]|nr:hypothetical protein BDZ97DRAFT_1806087 [Flammula alnicola]